MTNEGKEINTPADLAKAIADVDKAEGNPTPQGDDEEPESEEEPIFALTIRPRFIMMHCIGSLVALVALVIVGIMVAYEAALATYLGSVSNYSKCYVDQVRLMLYTSMVFKALIFGFTIYVILEGFFSICLPLAQPILQVISGVFLISMPVCAVVSTTCFFVLHGLIFGSDCNTNTSVYSYMWVYVLVNWLIFKLGCAILTVGHCLSACVMSWGMDFCSAFRRLLRIRINLGEPEEIPNIAEDGSD